MNGILRTSSVAIVPSELNVTIVNDFDNDLIFSIDVDKGSFDTSDFFISRLVMLYCAKNKELTSIEFKPSERFLSR